ncbi:HD domain-containing phosphohydrolase [Roseibium sp.]|uniref:HD-GYP domain-containing protein n=1 Tax=Roseibium sp. TaxID=1936156 RepID=UPI003264AF70
MQVILSASDLTKISKQFLCIASTYPAKLVRFPDLDPDVPSDAVMIADFLAAPLDHLHHLKALRDRSGFRMIGLVDLQNRRQVMQVRELGCHELVDRNDSSNTLLGKLRGKLGDYAQPQLDGSVCEQVRVAVTHTCASLNEMTAAALNGTPLPVRKLVESARDIAATIESEGIDAWLSAVQQHHSHTFCHTMMVTGHTIRFSKALGLPEPDQIRLGLGALVHDLGKIKIPLSILDKPGRLTDAERKLVNRHPDHGRQILETSGGMPEDACEIAVSHHEFIDGTGYPKGLKGSQISRSVRIVTICDIYSALTEKRAYKDSYSPRQAFSILNEMDGKLDTKLLRSFRDTVFSNDLGQLRRAAV